MKKYSIAILTFIICLGGVAYGQYVASTIQSRIDLDNQRIQNDLQDINFYNSDIQNIAQDQQASSVTANVPAIQAIEASQTSQPVSANTAMPAQTI